MVPAPKNLRFSEVGQTSFRATWEHGAPDVELYRIGWTKQGENNFKYVRSFIHLFIHIHSFERFFNPNQPKTLELQPQFALTFKNKASKRDNLSFDSIEPFLV